MFAFSVKLNKVLSNEDNKFASLNSREQVFSRNLIKWFKRLVYVNALVGNPRPSSFECCVGWNLMRDDCKVYCWKVVY